MMKSFYKFVVLLFFSLLIMSCEGFFLSDLDDCGVPDGDNSTCLDECGIPNGSGIEIGKCDCNGNILGCDGVCGSKKVFDICGVCDGKAEFDYNCGCDNVNQIKDCLGECGGSAVIDDCGVCNGDSTICKGCMIQGADNFSTIFTISDSASCYIDFSSIEPILNNNGEVIAHAFIYRQLLREQIIGQIAVFDPGFAPIDSSDYLFRFQTYGSGQYDFWGGANVVPSFPHSEFETNIPDTSILPDISHYNMPDTLQTIVDLWNCSERVISVGNVKNRMGHTSFNGTEYVGPTLIQVGEIAMTSSKGPNRMGIVKPDVSAAGDISLASGSFSWLNNPANHGNMDEGGLHVRNGGTSMASPAVAGIAALYLQKCSKANYNDFKTDLTNNTIIDSFTGSVPNYAYGYGKANALSTVLAKHQSVTIDGPNGICPGGSIDLSFVSGMNPILIQWSNGSNASTIVTTIPNDYTVNLEDDLGCISRSPIHPVSIYSDPVINAGSDLLICPNTQTILNATGTASVYEWTNNVINGEPFYPSSGIYIVTGTNTSGCSSQDSLSIEFLSTLPVSYNESITTIGVNQNAFNVSPGDPLGGVYSGNGIIGTSFHPALAGVGLHYVTYSYTDGNGCIASDSSAIEVYEDASINNQEDKEWLIYPNPTSNELFIEVYTPVEISIQDMTGRIVFTDYTSTPKITHLKNLKSGIYVLSLLAIGSNQEKTFRIIKN